MKVLHWINFILILAFLSACSAGGIGGNGLGDLFSTSTPLPPPIIGITPAPNAEAAVTEFFNAVQKDDYETMYAMLAKSSRDAITLEDFSKRWNTTLNEMSAASIEYSIISSQVSPYSAEVGYSVTYKTVLAGDLQRNIIMRLANEEGVWKVLWDDGLIMPELVGGNSLAMEYSIPARGDIYARDGEPIVSQSDAFAFGIQTDQIDIDMIGALTGELGRLCGYDPEYIQDQIDAYGPGYYIPMCEGTRVEAQRLRSINPGGLVAAEYSSRYYPQTGLAPQAVGYTLSIDTEELSSYRRLGYNGSEKVGKIGIELWAEEYLSGKHGGILRVIGPGGEIISTLGQSNRQAADSVYLTVDENMQKYAQQAIEYFRGAVVIMEVDTGRIIAMASAPDFDPNYFEPTNPNNIGLGDLVSDPNQPTFNRAAQGQYPLGSVFKIITFSAALESGAWVKDTPYDCQYEFTRLAPAHILRDWTYQHCQDALAIGETCNSSSELPSGLLTLQQGLMRSCNPYFWEIGWDLFTNLNRGTDIANMARAFGLGSLTGIEQIEESAGQILDPPTDIDAVNQAIGQGDVQVTPLQVATFMAAIANGGTLYRPQIVEKILPVDGDPLLVFEPEARSKLPLSTENLDILREALLMVTQNSKGTAAFNLRGLQFDVAGKTGTAESGNGLSHAWFAGYTLNAENTGQPDIAIAVIVENIGEGSEYAVPIFRAMVETYYYGSPQRIFYDFGPIGQPPYTPTPFGQTSNEEE